MLDFDALKSGLTDLTQIARGGQKVVFSDDDGKTWWTSRDSSIPIKFPYMVPVEPEKVYVLNVSN
jgi:hypothetical protein